MSSTSTTWITDTNTKSGTVQIYDSSVSTLRITAGESTDAILELFADEGDDNADKWRLWINDADDDLHFSNYTSGSWGDLLTIQDGGNVGIGTSAPQWPLEVKGNTTTAQNIMVVSADDDDPVFLVGKDSSDNGTMLLYTGVDANTVKFNSSGLSWLTGGNVGIGCSDAEAQLDISKDSGDAELMLSTFDNDATNMSSLIFRKADGTRGSEGIVVNGDALGQIEFTGYDNTGDEYLIGSRIIAKTTGTVSDGQMPCTLEFHTNSFGTDASARMYINHGGLVGIGTSPSSGQLHIDQSGASTAIPVLRLDQGDADETFIDFIGSSEADGSASISSDTTEDGAKFGAIRIEINGTHKWIRIYDDHS